jgi:serine protease Do
LVGADPRLELAVLKIDIADAPHLDLARAATAVPGTRVLAVSNLYNVAAGDEPASVQHGTVSARTKLSARRGTYQTPYTGEVYVIDAVTNNPGAAGGALVNLRGELVGLLGKELRANDTNTWLNYALPIAAVRDDVVALAAGKGPRRVEAAIRKPEQAHDLAALGIVLVPDALPRTPPYVDRVREGSTAAKAGVRPDDLVILLGGRLVPSCQAVAAEIGAIDRADPVTLTLLRTGQLVEVRLEAAGGAP